MIKSSLMKSVVTFSKVILFYGCSIVVFAASNAVFNTSNFPVLSFVLASLCTLGLIFLFVQWDNISLQQVGLGFKKRSISSFFVGVCVGTMMVGIMALIISNASEVTFSKSAKFQTDRFAVYILLYLFIAIREELSFRTYILWRLTDKMGQTVSIICVTVLFVFEHLIAGTEIKNSLIGSGMGALLFCIATLRTGNIALATGLHFAWNTSQWILGFKDGSGIYIETVAQSNEYYAEMVAYSSYCAVMILGIIMVTLLFKQQKELFE